jgi:hypothetical protein
VASETGDEPASALSHSADSRGMGNVRILSHGTDRCVIVSGSDRARLEAIASDPNRPQKHAERARVVLASLAGDPLQRVAAQAAPTRPPQSPEHRIRRRTSPAVCRPPHMPEERLPAA